MKGQGLIFTATKSHLIKPMFLQSYYLNVFIFKVRNFQKISTFLQSSTNLKLYLRMMDQTNQILTIHGLSVLGISKKKKKELTNFQIHIQNLGQIQVWNQHWMEYRIFLYTWQYPPKEKDISISKSSIIYQPRISKNFQLIVN